MRAVRVKLTGNVVDLKEALKLNVYEQYYFSYKSFFVLTLEEMKGYHL